MERGVLVVAHTALMHKHNVTTFGKYDSQKCLIWPEQLASKASRGLLDVFRAICYFPVNTPEDAQVATAHRGVNTDCGRW